MSARRTLRIAHRGDWRRAPENTLAALEAALAIPGCDGLEFDVRLSRDRVPVLLHDETLARVQGVGRRVDAVDAVDLEALGVPALRAVLLRVAELRPDAFLDIELKGADHGRTTADVLRDGLGDAPTHAVVSSFEPETLETMRAWLPRWGRWLNAADAFTRTMDEARRLGCSSISVEWQSLDEPAVQRATEAGLDVAAWTIRDEQTARRLEGLGIVAICVEGEALDGR